MNERLLQYIWQFQLFNTQQLKTTDGLPIQVLHAGTFNQNQGPDFSEGRIRIADTLWIGHVELHIRSSDWNKHRHNGDSNYQPVILHVVWQEDIKVNNIPVLELNGLVAKRLLEKYEQLHNRPSFIPCEQLITPLPTLIWQSWRDRLLMERLDHKEEHILQLLLQNRYNWEETCWWLLARNFGMKVNADAFEAIAQSIPLSLLARQKHSLLQLEALLLGQAGLLTGNYTDSYPQQLQQEYNALANKYDLHPILFPLHLLRMRPVNFPTIRLAQLAAIVYERQHLFASFRNSTHARDIRRLLDIKASTYWNDHYLFDEPSTTCEKKVGSMLCNSVIINTLSPLLYTYGHYHKKQDLIERAIDWLSELLPENNQIVSSYARLGIPATDAADTQAMLEMKKSYCTHFRCLDCSVGNHLLRTKEK